MIGRELAAARVEADRALQGSRAQLGSVRVRVTGLELELQSAALTVERMEARGVRLQRGGEELEVRHERFMVQVRACVRVRVCVCVCMRACVCVCVNSRCPRRWLCCRACPAAGMPGIP